MSGGFFHLGADAAIAPEHPVRAVAAAVEAVGLGGIALPPELFTERGAYPLLLAQLWAYGRWAGLSDSTHLAQACAEQLPFAWLTGSHGPSAATLSLFLKQNTDAMAQLLEQVDQRLGAQGQFTTPGQYVYAALAADSAQGLSRTPVVSTALPTAPRPMPTSFAAAPLAPAPQAASAAPVAAGAITPLVPAPALAPKPGKEFKPVEEKPYTPPPRTPGASSALMLATLVRKEVLNHLLSFRFLVSSALCVMLMALSSFVLLDNYATRKDSFDANSSGYRTSAGGENSYYILELKGINLERPPTTLQAFFTGLEKNPDRRARMWSFLNPAFQGEMDIDPTPNMFPMVDYLFIVGVVMSLLAFIFSYDAVTGEREGGTLKLLLSYSVPRDLVIMGKWIGGYISLLLPFLVGVLLSAILVLAKARVLNLQGADWSSFGVCIVLSLMYIAVMYSVGLYVSVTVLRSSTAIAVLLFIWVIFVLIIPNASPYVVDQIKPVTSASQMQAKTQEALGGVVSEVANEVKASFKKYKDNIAKLQEFMNETLTKVRDRTNAIQEEQDRAYRRELDEQIKLTQMVSLVSPLSAFTYAATEVADTGIGRDRHLREYMNRFQDDYRNWIENRINSSTKEGVTNSFGFKEQKFDISDMPVFQYKPRAMDQRLNEVLVPIALLAVFIVAFFFASYMSFLKKDIIG